MGTPHVPATLQNASTFVDPGNCLHVKCVPRVVFVVYENCTGYLLLWRESSVDVQLFKRSL